jgi:hypothetical protein
MKSHTLVTITVMSLAGLTAIAVTSAGAENAAPDRGASHASAGLAWRTQSTAGANDRDSAHMARMVLTGDHLSAGKNRMVQINSHRHVSASPTTDGAICWTSDDSSLDFDDTAGCFENFTEAGLGASYDPGVNDPPFEAPAMFRGLVAADVTEAKLHLTNNDVVPVSVEDGAIFWVATGREQVDYIETVRKGKSFVEREVFH